MAGDDGGRRRLHQTAATILVLCCLAQSLTCFSLRGLIKNMKQNEGENEATVTKLRTGSSVLNGKELNSQSGFASAAATGNDGLLPIDWAQSGGSAPKGMLEQTSQLGDNMADEAAMKHLNPSLHCGQSKMKFKAMGPGAAALQLDMGNARPLPLIQVPETCGYSMQQNALGLVLVVPYDGCNVLQEDGSYVLPLHWLGTPVKLTCPMLTHSATPASTSPKPAEQLRPLWAQSLNRRKRKTQPVSSYYDPRTTDYYNYLYNYYLYYYYMQMMMAMTTAKPDTSSTTTKPSTQKHPAIWPPTHPLNSYYPYYSYNPYYYYYYYHHLATTTASPTTGPVTSGITTAKPPCPTTKPGGANPTVKPPCPTTKPGGANPTVKPPCPTTKPGGANPTVKPPCPTTKPGGANPTVKPPCPTTKPGGANPTVKPPCPTKLPFNPFPENSFVHYDQLSFPPYVSYKAGKLPTDLKDMPLPDYRSGLQHDEALPHPGFNHWQPMPLFPHSPDKDLKFNWKLPEPK